MTTGCELGRCRCAGLGHHGGAVHVKWEEEAVVVAGNRNGGGVKRVVLNDGAMMAELIRVDKGVGTLIRHPQTFVENEDECLTSRRGRPRRPSSSNWDAFDGFIGISVGEDVAFPSGET